MSKTGLYSPIEDIGMMDDGYCIKLNGISETLIVCF